MDIPDKIKNPSPATIGSRFANLPNMIWNYTVIAALVFTIFYLSLVTTSAPLPTAEREALNRAIVILEEKGFENDAFLLSRVTTFRLAGNWLNGYSNHENAYAATNFPLEIVTLYPDFFNKAIDDTERAMILLHEAQHLKGSGEKASYEYVWQNREKLGWTQLSHGTTETYTTIELQTREHSPDLFNCSEKLWSDCTENLRAMK